ncbi:MAG: hypothetical protein JEZ14_26030 [Marinilabiliaceae bacterium]|nr:hypothetical protein [Marinilabiliaceae bacterium]
MGITNLLFGLHMMLGGLSIFATLKIKSFIQATNIHKIEEAFIELNATAEKQRNKYEKLFVYSSIILWSLNYINKLKNTSREGRDCEKDISDLMNPLVHYRSAAFDFQNSDLYNIALYLYNANEDQLEQFFRKCDDRIEVHGRSWKPPFGYIGYAHWINGVIISSEYPNQPSATTGKALPSDKEFYASCVAAAIPGNMTGGKPIGVLIISSSRENQFSSNDTSLTDFISEYVLILSQYFEKYFDGNH